PTAPALLAVRGVVLEALAAAVVEQGARAGALDELADPRGLRVEARAGEGLLGRYVEEALALVVHGAVERLQLCLARTGMVAGVGHRTGNGVTAAVFTILVREGCRDGRFPAARDGLRRVVGLDVALPLGNALPHLPRMGERPFDPLDDIGAYPRAGLE